MGAATAALEELTDKIISGDADSYTEMSQGKDSEIVRAMSVLSEDDLRRTGNSTTNTTPSPTAAPTSATTITQVITATYPITASEWDIDATGIREMSECAYGKAIGIATIAASGWTYSSGCSMDSTAAAARRSNSLAVTYTAGVSASLEASAASAANSITSASFTAELNMVQSTVTAYGSLAVPTVSDVATPTVTDNSTPAPTAAPTTDTVVGSAPAGAGLSFLS